MERSLASLTDAEETAARTLMERERVIRSQCEMESTSREEVSKLGYLKEMEELRRALDAEHQVRMDIVVG